MIREVKAPNDYPENGFSLFLAGSIEMGKAKNWQETAVGYFRDAGLPDEPDLTILNPRREDWDAAAEQSPDNDYFRKQVEWELRALEDASCILMHLEPGTKGPISLLETGLHARDQKLVVSCPDGFWRKGNVQITAEMYDVPVCDSLEDALGAVSSTFAHFMG